MDAQEIRQILEEHKEWLSSDGHLGRRADLSGANLSEADLSEANLRWADLSGADLRWADLRWANLSGANLSGANLRWADLSGANLSGANLRWADLSGADLRWANLSGADLSEANLSGANLSGANLRWANLSGADLSEANLSGANPQRTKGIGGQSGEQGFAALLHQALAKNPEYLENSRWHTCATTHCIAGHYLPQEENPGPKASRELPTLARYFFASNDEAIAAIERVAKGEESVFLKSEIRRLP